MSSFSDFKNRSRNNISNLTQKLEDMNKKDSYKDDRFWRPELDKSSNGFAVIRFLPAAGEEDLRGQNIILMDSKARVVGTSRIHALLSVRRIQSQR